jgi:cell division protein YceG involved in septum cleavage
MKTKKVKILIIIIFCSLTMVASSCFIFYREFNRLNDPIMAGIELIKLVITNKDYIIIQENPKVIIAKSDNAFNILVEYMMDQGLQYTEQLGAAIIFENDLSEKQILSFHKNRYYSIWEW